LTGAHYPARSLVPEEPVGCRAAAEDGHADPDDGGSFLDRFLEIRTHPHREVFEIDTRHRQISDLVPDLSKPDEASAGGLSVGEQEADRHQALIAREPADAAGPLLIGDYTDCPGGGAAGDGTLLLKAMIDSGVPDFAFGSIADPVAAKAGIGQDVRLELGGKMDPRFGGGPLTVTGKVLAVLDGAVVRKGPYSTGKVTSFGPSCVVEVGGVKIIVATKRAQIDDREQFRIFGIQPETTNVLVCKAVNHFRADYEKIGRRLVHAESGGIMSLNFAQFPFRQIRRPIWPLDDI